jgi:hypothetical protein
MGRPRTTGRFNTPEELADYVLWQYASTPDGFAAIARRARVSETLVARIVNNARSKPQKSIDSSQ